MTARRPFLRDPASSSIDGRRAASSPHRFERSLRWIVTGILSVVFCQASSFAVDRVFLEAGLGAHLLSNVRFSDLYLSTSLQFGSHIGAGIYFGRDRKFSLVYRFQHLSNASVKQPNPGIEFHLLQFGFRVGRRR